MVLNYNISEIDCEIKQLIFTLNIVHNHTIIG